MSLYPDITREVDGLPDGPQIGAFFDFDGTVIGGYSALAFLKATIKAGDLKPSGVVRQLLAGVDFARGRAGFSALMEQLSQSLVGRTEHSYIEFGEAVYRKELAGLVYPETRALIEAHKRKGHTIAICSSATRYQIEPAAHDLGVDQVLATELEVKDGVFTGHVVRPTLWGPGKANAVEAFCQARGIELADSYFYADGSEDAALMSRIGHPRPLNPHGRLRALAHDNGWPVRDFSSRGTPGFRDIVRTTLATGAIFPAFLSALPILALGGSKREALNTAGAIWGDLATGIIGMKLDVRGEANIHRARPCIFVFNHQSNMDMLVILRLIRYNLTGVGKKEIGEGLLGPFFRYADILLIDRSDPRRAIESMKRLAERVQRENLSIAIAPEGTRSLSTRLGQFKKGAFHLALACRIPMVPIVIHNALDVQHRHTSITRPATVRVDVLEPIDTSDWTRANLEQQMRNVRQLFLDTLGQREAEDDTASSPKSTGPAAGGKPPRKRASGRGRSGTAPA